QALWIFVGVEDRHKMRCESCSFGETITPVPYGRLFFDREIFLVMPHDLCEDFGGQVEVVGMEVAANGRREFGDGCEGFAKLGLNLRSERDRFGLDLLTALFG